MKKRNSVLSGIIFIIIAVISLIINNTQQTESISFDLSSIPPYSGKAWVKLNNDVPLFTEDEITNESFESYSELDTLGRCGVCIASVGQDIMPTEERGRISSVKPTAWHSVQYDNIDGGSLYNRCHLIGFQLTGENANYKNLITGTRYMNIDGMVEFENRVANYVKETGNHVMYRATPIFDGDNLLASGVTLEGYSVEDNGKGVSFYVFCYNVQPDIYIDYKTGDSYYIGTQKTEPADDGVKSDYIVNIKTGKFHLETCPGVGDIKETNRKIYTETREYLMSNGYSPCGICNP